MELEPLEKYFPDEAINKLMEDHGISNANIQKLKEALTYAQENYISEKYNSVSLPSKRQIQQAAKSVKKTLKHIDDKGMKTRLCNSAASVESDGDIVTQILALSQNYAKVNKCINALKTLEDLFSKASKYKTTSGKIGDFPLQCAVIPLWDFWKEGLDRKVTMTVWNPIEDTANKPSPIVRFVYDCLLQIDPDVQILTVFNVLKDLRDREPPPTASSHQE